jgi:malate dehydrogenase (quinone)
MAPVPARRRSPSVPNLANFVAPAAGDELVAAEDKSLIALLGPSPGASTAAFIAVGVLEKCFASELTESSWLPKLKEIIPTYGIDLTRDADACRKTRAHTAATLKVENI